MWLELWTVVCLFLCPHGLRVRGTYSTEEFFVFLAKFGFEKTDVQATEQTQVRRNNIAKNSCQS